jgi:hypothetical protein
MTLQIITTTGRTESYAYEHEHAPRLARALAKHWHHVARVTVHVDNLVWIIKP